MNRTKTIKRTILASAVTLALGTANTILAAELTFSFEGLFTLLDGAGGPSLNPNSPISYGLRTAVVGTGSFDTDTGVGTADFSPFSFNNAGFASATSISFNTVGDGTGGPGNLILANMGFNWNANNGIPVSVVMDATGFFDALGSGAGVGDTITGTGSIPASNNASALGGLVTFPIGPAPFVTTTSNTTDIGTVALGSNPSGTLPFITDTVVNTFVSGPPETGVGGSPMRTAPFAGFNANFDFTEIVITSDGTGDITAPEDIMLPAPETPGPVKSLDVELGNPTGLAPPTATAEYCLEGIAICDADDKWIADGENGANNPISIEITQTVNTKVVDWRSQLGGSGLAFDTQTITATVDDNTPPVIDTMPIDIMPSVDSTPANVCFTGDDYLAGQVTASDVWDANPTIQWSLDGFFPGNPNNPVENCTSDFGPNENTVYWRITDSAGNITDRQQKVTLVLPEGIVGTDCVIDLTTAGDRDMVGTFIMRDPGGSQTGSTDTTITGRMDTTLLCNDEDSCTEDSAAWVTTQPFQGLLWTAAPVRLFGTSEIAPSWTFETCPGDASVNCTEPPPPRPLSMTSVGPNQLSAHMLFAWGAVEAIDVVVVWDVDCGASMLTTTDPDGDGILGTRMVDGPFQGFNAAFDMSTAPGEPNPIAEGGFTTLIPTYQNPITGGSPPPLDNVWRDASDFPPDAGATSSCVGNCADFRVTNLMDATDGVGPYKFTKVVLPLDESLPFWSLLRKFKGGAWQDYVIDSRNKVESALRNPDGSCPEPGAGDYKVAGVNSLLANKLEFGDECLQLTIEDNGPNDIDPDAGEIEDPVGPAAVAAPPAPRAQTSGSNGCSLSTSAIDPAKRADWTLIGVMLAALGFFSLRRRRKQRD